MNLSPRVKASLVVAPLLVLLTTGCAPKTFVRSAPGWKTIGLRQELIYNYDEAWQKTVDSIAQNWEIEMLDKDSGYLRTAWVYGIGTGRQIKYRGRITVKYPEIKMPEKVEVKISAEWWAYGSPYAPIWVKGYDSSFQRDVFAELSGRLGQTVPVE